MNAVVEFQQYSNANFEQIRTRFDEEFGVMWSFMRPEPRPCFTHTLLEECHYIAHHSNFGMMGRVIEKNAFKKVTPASSAAYRVCVSCLMVIMMTGTCS